MCTPAEIARYQRRISGPLLDRIDMVIEVSRVPFDEPGSLERIEATNGVTLDAIRSRIHDTRQLQRARNGDGELNGFQRWDLVEALGKLPPASRRLVARIGDRYALTGRGLVRLLRVARTIADLAGSESIETIHVAEAAAYRLPPEYGPAHQG